MAKVKINIEANSNSKYNFKGYDGPGDYPVINDILTGSKALDISIKDIIHYKY